MKAVKFRELSKEELAQKHVEMEQEYGVSAGVELEPLLVVRLFDGERFQDFDSDQADHTIDAAARTVADEIEGWVKRRKRAD